MQRGDASRLCAGWSTNSNVLKLWKPCVEQWRICGLTRCACCADDHPSRHADAGRRPEAAGHHQAPCLHGRGDLPAPQEVRLFTCPVLDETISLHLSLHTRNLHACTLLRHQPGAGSPSMQELQADAHTPGREIAEMSVFLILLSVSSLSPCPGWRTTWRRMWASWASGAPSATTRPSGSMPKWATRLPSGSSSQVSALSLSC